MENTKTVLKNEIHIAGTVVSMRMEERGNCILVIRSNAERQIRNIQLRFYDINQAIIFRVGDHVRIAGHMQNRRTQDAEGNYHSTPTIVGDSIAVSKRRLTQILDESIPEQGGGAQADENWGVLAGIVTSIRTPTDKVTFLNIRIPSGRRDYNCRVTCLGRFQRAAANLKEGENVAVSCYVSVLDDTQRESRQSLVCTDLFSYGESDEAPKAPEEPTESLQPEEEANNDKNESFDPPAVPANPETGVDAFSEKRCKRQIVIMKSGILRTIRHMWKPLMLRCSIHFRERRTITMKRQPKIIIACLVMAVGLTSCTVTPADPSTGKYATQYPQTTLEYSIYINKQITVFVNELSTRLNQAVHSTDGVYENETEATEQSIQLLQETLDNVTAMQPSVGKEDDRLSLITAMQTALDHMKEYKESVESGETDLTNYSHIFETDINVLTGMASLYNQ